MPMQNRVTPLGEIVATPERGLLYGNRGCLHDADGRVVRHHVGRRWIACALAFKGRRRFPLLQPGRYTGLFFLDEATALAAGHRPCAECRRADYRRLCAAIGLDRADAIDERLHAERLGARRTVDVRDLPDGAFVLQDAPRLVLGDALLRWTPGGYDDPRPRRGRAELVTPPLLVDALRSGYEPLVHPRISCAVSSGRSSCGQWPTPSSTTQSAHGSSSR
jgi:hypothetical protein